MKSLKKWPIEWMFWVVALLALYFAVPEAPHFDLCPLSQAGLEFCPGCGIGRSIHYLMHGEWQSSWSSHYLGAVALIVIIIRVGSLSKLFISEVSFRKRRKL